MKFTILGSTGFIGRHLVMNLREQGVEVDTPARDIKTLKGKNLGHVIYAIGMTGNFRQHPDATVEAHVNVLKRLLDGAEFLSWLYLSSTRVYGGKKTTHETDKINITPETDIYDASKLQGEAICLAHPQKTVRVARLSNVYGADQSRSSFLGMVMESLTHKDEVVLQESPQSAKDYIAIDDAIQLLQEIALRGKDRVYNVASGRNTTHQDLADKINACGFKCNFTQDATTRAFPVIDTTRITKEFGGRTRPILQDLPLLLQAVQHQYKDGTYE